MKLKNQVDKKMENEMETRVISGFIGSGFHTVLGPPYWWTGGLNISLLIGVVQGLL